MKEKSSDSPFIEEMGGDETSTPAVVEADQPAPTESPASTEPVQPEDKSVRLEAEIKYLRDRVEESEAAFAGFKRQTRWFIVVLLMLIGVGGFVLVQMKSRDVKQSEAVKAIADQLANGKAAGNLPATDRSPRISSVAFFHWEQGQPPVRLIGRNEGICMLTKVSGHFEGGGESVRLWIDKDGYWYLGGDSHQRDVNAECAVLKY